MRIKLFNSEGDALTSLHSDFDGVLPNEIIVTEDSATACHADSGDVVYGSLAALCDAYHLDLEEVSL